ncbi:MAG: hypothetical protein WCT27_00005 [Patescibacteria group bacterium]
MSIPENQMNALISAFNKNGLIERAKRLLALGWHLFASGGTAKHLIAAGLPVTDIADLTGLGAVLGHRVVTLQPPVHGGLLVNLSEIEQIEEILRLKWPIFQLVHVDVYPFREEMLRAGATFASILEKIDIGGPTMLKSGAKGLRITTTCLSDLDWALDQLTANGDLTFEERRRLSGKAFAFVARYYGWVAEFMSEGEYKTIVGRRVGKHKKGENAWMGPYTVYSTDSGDPLSLPDHLVQEGGIDCSFVNYCDYERILQVLTHIAANFQVNGWPMPYIAIAVKHGNPCGASFGRTAREALENMINGDTRAIHGAVVILNFMLDTVGAETLAYYNYSGPRKRILHSIIAPAIDDAAKTVLQGKEEKCRFLTHSGLAILAPFGDLTADVLDRAERIRYIRGGFITGSNYTKTFNVSNPNLVKEGAELDLIQQQTLTLGEAINMSSNSNTSTLVKDGMLIGNGVGQQDRVGGTELAIKRAKDAGHDTKGSINIQDSFFPFPDGAERAIEAGAIAILATSGSTVSDKKVRKTISDAGVTYWTLPDDEDRRFSNH